MIRVICVAISIFAALAGALFSFRLIMQWDAGMNHPRSEIHAAMLDDKIYVAGGIGLFRVLDSCEYYTIPTNKWSNCAPLPRPLHHVAMASDKSHIYASGGYVALPFEKDKKAALFRYDPATDAWQEMAKLPHPIGQHAMVHRAGKLLLIGGQNGLVELSAFWSYDIASNQWSEMPPMPTARHSHAITMANDKLYVTGGRSAALGNEIHVVEAYDFAAGIWERLSDMPVGRAGHGAFVGTDTLHIFGGESLSEGKLLPSHDVLDLQTGRWSKGSPMAMPRHGFAIGDNHSGDSVRIIGGGAHPGFQTIYSVTGTVQNISK